MIGCYTSRVQVEDTCPYIDSVIRVTDDAIKYIDRCSSDAEVPGSVSTMLSEISSDLSGIGEVMEKIRSLNAELRSTAQEALDRNTERDDILKEAISQLERIAP